MYNAGSIAVAFVMIPTIIGVFLVFVCLILSRYEKLQFLERVAKIIAILTVIVSFTLIFLIIFWRE